MHTEHGTATLSIRETELDDKGFYTVRATNVEGEAEAKTTLFIICIDPVINTDLDTTLQGTEGETMTLKLAVSGTPKPDIVRMKGNDELAASDRVQVTVSADNDDTYASTIFNVQPKDLGEDSAKITRVDESLQSNKYKVTVSGMWVWMKVRGCG
ncbi:unnamed protein product [Didymodactylos carnosus]|uniref:Immunoglobulin I-set domain-containing protein n=1 Tax=Didymodactylos carnosus TaxID=1234261 RepID=A0A814KMQ8_9BILA|nr:unnamed protein product [Didymodactylos carnosus]CAF3821153.1 unnamed protein product [Didymodactylos carnosus]